MKQQMIAILTGDIVNSRGEDPQSWQSDLKALFLEYGPTPELWEIFRGDSFQLEVPVEDSLLAAIRIKALIKQHKNLDVRIAIGIGKQDYKRDSITESNGEAYTNSGTCFEQLKKRRLAIKSPWRELDEEWNLYLDLASLSMNHWASKTAMILKVNLDHPEISQVELSKMLDRSQSTISEALKRAGFDEIEKLLKRFASQIPHKQKAI